MSSLIGSGMERLGSRVNADGIRELTKFGKSAGYKALILAAGGLGAGISSTIAGGNFWDGMRQGLITTGLNALAHGLFGQKDPGDPKAKKTNLKYKKTEIDWGKVAEGSFDLVVGIGGTAGGVMGLASGFTPLGVAGITFGVPMVGFGLASIIDGFQGGNHNLPGGFIEGIDVGLGGNGTYGQIIDIFGTGLPKNTAEGVLFMHGVYKSNLYQSTLNQMYNNLVPNNYNHNHQPIDNLRIYKPQ